MGSAKAAGCRVTEKLGVVRKFNVVRTFLATVNIPVQNAGPDLAMLSPAMRLVITPTDEVGDGSLYSLAKHFLAALEREGIVSLLCFKAVVLIALYEHSHAMHPAAWMTIGACARYADMLGLSCRGNDVP